jgi:hypothetical protein
MNTSALVLVYINILFNKIPELNNIYDYKNNIDIKNIKNIINFN